MGSCLANYSEIKERFARNQEKLCIVGFGNRERRDDGVGPWVVEELEGQITIPQRVRLLTRPQLDLDLLDELSQVDLVILVDASVECLEGGISWTRVEPGQCRTPFLTHSLEPGFMLSLMEAVHQRLPATWLVSIQGEEFNLGEELSPPTLDRARQVVADLVKMIAEEDRT